MNKINKLSFPALLILAVMMLTPLLDKAINADYTPLTYVTESICGALFIGFIAVAAINTFNDGK